MDELITYYPELKDYLKDNRIKTINEFDFSRFLVFLKTKPYSNISKIIKTYQEKMRNNKICSTYIGKSDVDVIFELHEQNDSNLYTQVKREKELRSIWLDINVCKVFLWDKLINVKDVLCVLFEASLRYDLLEDKNSFIDCIKDRLNIERINLKVLNNLLMKYFNIIDLFSEYKTLITRLYDEAFRFEKPFVITNTSEILLKRTTRNVFLTIIVSKSFLMYAHKNNIRTINDVILWQTPKRNEKYYYELKRIKIYQEQNDIDFTDGVIDKYIYLQKKEKELIYLMMRIKGSSYTFITEMTNLSEGKIRRSIYQVIDCLIGFFDKGGAYLKELFSYEDGYASKEMLKKILPKYYLLIIFLVQGKYIHNVFYNQNYSIITPYEMITDELIINKYPNYLTISVFNDLLNELRKMFINKGIGLSCKRIKKRLLIIYKETQYGYYRGNLTKEIKIRMIYNMFFPKGLLKREYQSFDDIYETSFGEKINSRVYLRMYCEEINETFFLKTQKGEDNELLNENKKKENWLYNDIICICENFRSIFSINDIIQELNLKKIDEKKIRKYLIKSKMYFQLSFSKFIATDKFELTYEHYELINHFYLKRKYQVKEDDLFEFLNERTKEILIDYKIHNHRYLKRIMDYIFKNRLI